VVVERPRPTQEAPQGLCLDKGYDSEAAEAQVTERGYTPHIRRIGDEKKDEVGQKTHPARRWVVERTFAWLSGCRAILVRYDKKAEHSLAHVKLACALLWFRRWYDIDPTLTF
jgi:putative transposase